MVIGTLDDNKIVLYLCSLYCGLAKAVRLFIASLYSQTDIGF